MPHNRNRLYLRFSSTKTIFFPFCVRSNIHNLHRYWFQICQTIVKNYSLLHRRRYKWLPWATDERWRTFLFWNQSPIYWRLVLVHAKRKAQSIQGFSFFICQVKFPIGFDVCCGFLRGNILVINHVNFLFFRPWRSMPPTKTAAIVKSFSMMTTGRVAHTLCPTEQSLNNTARCVCFVVLKLKCA